MQLAARRWRNTVRLATSREQTVSEWPPYACKNSMQLAASWIQFVPKWPTVACLLYLRVHQPQANPHQFYSCYKWLAATLCTICTSWGLSKTLCIAQSDLLSSNVKSSIVEERKLHFVFIPSTVEEQILCFVFVPSIVGEQILCFVFVPSIVEEKILRFVFVPLIVEEQILRFVFNPLIVEAQILWFVFVPSIV